MKIDTTRFGPLEVAPEQLFHFPEGLAGLPGKSWVLHQPNGHARLGWLQSAEDPAVAVVIAEPSVLFPDYAPKHRPEEASAVDEGPREYWVLVRQGPTPGQLLANLFAPLVLNREKRLGVQLPLVGSDFGLAEPWPKEPPV
ncbi:MAG: flagellar assembly protein FliW [Myxococcota bacterium]